MKRSMLHVRLWLTLTLLLIGSFLLTPGPATAKWAVESAPAPHLPSVAEPLRVGIQAGHWKAAEAPDALRSLRNQTGAYYGGRSEWALNLDIARRTAEILRAQGIAVDVWPVTIPTGYRADAFISLHADANGSSRARGYKVATRWRSNVAWRDQILTETVGETYARLTGLPRDPSVTRGMQGYYAFNTYRGTEHRVARSTPSMILEMGFITNGADRALLFDRPGTVANAVAQGLLAYLRNAASANAIQARAQAVADAADTGRAVVVTSDGVRIRSATNGGGTVIRTANRGEIYPYADTVSRPGAGAGAPIGGRRSTQLAAGGWSKITVPGYDGDAYISRDYSRVQEND
jgi:hypothetical protein